MCEQLWLWPNSGVGRLCVLLGRVSKLVTLVRLRDEHRPTATWQDGEHHGKADRQEIHHHKCTAHEGLGHYYVTRLNQALDAGRARLREW